MTNIIAEISIALTLTTNWTGVTSGKDELGYVLTNHVATVVYAGTTNQMRLKDERSSIAVWRPKGLESVTNFIWPTPQMFWTNNNQFPGR